VSVTLLLDLDNTLLKNDTNTFLPTYLDSFSKEVSDLIEPDIFVKALLAGTHEMVLNNRPDCTLQDVFTQTFFQYIGLDPNRFHDMATRFYTDIFPTLKALTQPIPEAIKLVETALDRGYKVVIATNPLFPLTAIEQRLQWANLPVDHYPFDLVTSFETFHFCKPNLAYITEILARLGCPTGPVVMVGDDIERDIQPAQELGLPAFWVNNGSRSSDLDTFSNIASGGIEDVIPWLDSVNDGSLNSDLKNPSSIMATLQATPAALDSFLRNLGDVSWTLRLDRNEWSITEIVCHLRDVDSELNFPRLVKVLNEPNPFISGHDTDRWAEERRYFKQDGKHAFSQFINIRLKLLNLLQHADESDWLRPARHAIFGPTSMEELASFIGDHDRLHINQIVKILNAIHPQRTR